MHVSWGLELTLMRCTFAPPGECDGMICVAAVMRAVATITAATCLHCSGHTYIHTYKFIYRQNRENESELLAQDD